MQSSSVGLGPEVENTQVKFFEDLYFLSTF